MPQKISDIKIIIRAWLKQKEINKERLLQLIYGKDITNPNQSHIKQISRVVKKIKNEGIYDVQKKKVKNKYRYIISKNLNINKKISKASFNTIKYKIDTIEKCIKENRVFNIEMYFGKDKNIKSYDSVYPIKTSINKNKKLSFFWAIILKDSIKENKRVIEADPEIKRFYFSRIDKMRNITQIPKKVLEKIEELREEYELDNFDARAIDDFGFLQQNNYDIKEFKIMSDFYFRSILISYHVDLFESIEIINTENADKPFEMTIRYVDIQRIANLIFPYLKNIEIIKNADKKLLIDYINLQTVSLARKGNLK